MLAIMLLHSGNVIALIVKMLLQSDFNMINIVSGKIM